MKNRLPFAALTFAFTIAGACMGYFARESYMIIVAIIFIGFIGGFAAAMCGDNL